MNSDSFLPIIYASKRNLANIEIDSFNNFLDEFPNVMVNEFTQEMSHTYPQLVGDNIKSVKFGYRFANVKYEKCYQMIKGQTKPVYPSHCQKSNSTYEIKVLVTFISFVKYYREINGKIVEDEEKVVHHDNKLLGSIPCMILCKMCHLYGMTTQDKIAIGEDSLDIGGYFRIEGSDKCQLVHKFPSKNIPQIHILKNHKSKFKIKCDFTSKPGDDYEKSTYMVLALTDNNAIVIVLTLGKELKLYLPFFVIFYLFGISNDQKIIGTIMPSIDRSLDIDQNLEKILRAALTMDYGDPKISSIKKEFITNHNFSQFYDTLGRRKRSPDELLLLIAHNINKNDTSAGAERYNLDSKNSEDLIKIREQIMRRLDKSIFPHIGVDPDSRLEKCKFFGSLIKSCCLTELGIIPPTDRNSADYQIGNASGAGLIATCKAVINIAYINNMNKSFMNAMKANYQTSFDDVFRSNHKATAIGENLAKALKAGNKEVLTINKNTEIKNRLITVIREVVNPISIIHSINGVTPDPNGIGGKANDSAIDARKVHASNQGITDHIQAVEGDSAGKAGQFTVGARITPIIDTRSIENMVIKELQRTDLAYNQKGYSIVYINNKAIGSHNDTYSLREKYVKLRRQGVIDRKTSIVYYPQDSQKLEFYTAQGRFIRPMLIVYSNYEERKKNKNIKFKQYVKYTTDHARKLSTGQMTLDDLEREGVIEYIAPIENINIICCDCYDNFVVNQDNPLSVFTHLVVPELEYCINTLTTPFGANSDSVRTLYQSKLAKQAIGFPIANYWNAYFAKFPIAYHTWKPIVQTVANMLAKIGGANVRMVIMTDGNNQEDSLTISERVTQSGKFGANMYVQHSIELENEQLIGIPVVGRTKNIKGTSYSHLNASGFPKPGTRIEPGMAILGLTKTDANGEEVDDSIIHKKAIPMIIDGYSSSCNKNGAKIIKIKMYSARPVEQGDKFASRVGNKGIVSYISFDEEMPILPNGEIVEFKFSPHSVPARMTINKLMECHTNEKGVNSGSFIDATMFKGIDMHNLTEEDKELGYTTLYNPHTGEKMKGECFTTHAFYQRLTRMVVDNYNSVNNPIIDIRTGQATKGIAAGGGPRLGEMESNTIWASGAMSLLQEKVLYDADSRKIIICGNCKKKAIVNTDPEYEIYYCQTCTNPVFVEVETCFATLALMEVLNSLGIDIEITPEAPAFAEL